ncbi:hypothetical protein SG34_028685 [Thalassomonas viridans]|uniref:DUF4402 domain-containing protein n=1 Tax=Thalassomonas viridans TaxID=137584 RepID=A0AAE9Z276_9GAMM|nr:hypothetical protein [Thalassomonas viridans]WDE05223.1 hypothetical protein SG34_028685 [Thalassomonas viridans]
MLNLNHNRITKVLTATFLTAVSAQSFAATAPSTVSVTVQNTFTLTEDTALSFGTVRATADPTGGVNIGTLVLAADGTTSTTAVANSSMTQLAAGSVGQFTVTNAAPFTNLTITFPADFELTAAAAPPGSPNFDILQADWTAIIRGGANDGVAYAGGNLQTDVAGTVSFDAGTSLKTDATVTTSAYIDAAYTGNYTMTVDY